jgi:general secretion pathway protein C
MTQTLSMSRTRPGFALPVRFGLAAVEVLLLAALAHVCARLIWLVAFGASATDVQLDAAGAAAAPRPAYIADLTRLREADPFADRRAVPAEAAPVAAAVQETRLDLVLRGIRRGASPDSGGAIVQTPDNRQRFFRVGETLLDGVTLEAVYVDHILIRRRGVTESLHLRDEEGRAGRAVPGGSAVPVPAASPAGTQTLAGLFRAEPVHEGHALTGYRIAGGNAAMLSAMGLRDGDVITAIDGRPAADLSDLPALFRTLRERGAFTLTVNRGGLPLTVQVDLPR